MESVETQALNEIKDSLENDMPTDFDKSIFDGLSGYEDSNYEDPDYPNYDPDYPNYEDPNYPNNQGKSNSGDHQSISICDPDFDKSEFLFYWDRNCTEDKTVSEICSPDICHINNCSS